MIFAIANSDTTERIAVKMTFKISIRISYLFSLVCIKKTEVCGGKIYI